MRTDVERASAGLEVHATADPRDLGAIGPQHDYRRIAEHVEALAEFLRAVPVTIGVDR